MNHLIKLIIFSFFFTFAAAQYGVDNYSKTFQDSSRSNRNILTEIYYPVPLQGEDMLSLDGQFPIILFGHGFLINWDTYQNLWDEFVPKGYIMVFPRTESGLNTDHQQFGWDLQFLVTKIQEEGDSNSSPIYNLVNNNTALMGHSMGGGASFLAADSLCVNNNNQLKTIIGLAVAESSSNGVSSIASALNVTIPALIISGSQDGVTPQGVHQLPIYNNLNSNYKTFISILGGGHCYFGNPNFFCDLGESASSNGISISRVEQQQVTFDFLNSWLDFTLKDDCEQQALFQDSLVNSNRIGLILIARSELLSVIVVVIPCASLITHFFSLRGLSEKMREIIPFSGFSEFVRVIIKTLAFRENFVIFMLSLSFISSSSKNPIGVLSSQRCVTCFKSLSTYLRK